MIKKQFFLFSLFFVSLNLFFIKEVCSQDVGINTVSQSDSGNWYEKLSWWKKSKPKYEEVVSIINKIDEMQKKLVDSRSKFIAKYEDLINFFVIDKEKTLQRISNFIKDIEVRLDEDPDLEEEDKDEYIEITQNKETLEQLNRDIESIESLKNSVDEAILDVLVRQVQLADSYEEVALESFEEIENVLDDKKARELYERIENSKENVQSILNYLNGPLTNFVNETNAKINQLSPKIQVTIQNLAEKKIFLRPMDHKKKVDQKDEEVKETSDEEVKSIWQKITGFIGSIFSGIWRIISYPFPRNNT